MTPDERAARKRFSKMPDGYYSVHQYSANHYAWIGVVVRKQQKKLTILTVGMEITKHEIEEWCKRVLTNRKNGGSPKSDPKDMRDRGPT